MINSNVYKKKFDEFKSEEGIYCNSIELAQNSRATNTRFCYTPRSQVAIGWNLAEPDNGSCVEPISWDGHGDHKEEGTNNNVLLYLTLGPSSCSCSPMGIPTRSPWQVTNDTD